MGLCDADPDHRPPRFIHEDGESPARASIPWPSPAPWSHGKLSRSSGVQTPGGSLCRPFSPRIRSRPRRSLPSKRGRIIRSGHGAGREIRCDASGRGTSRKPNTAAPMWKRSTRSGAACVAVLASNWRQLPGDSGKRARWRCGRSRLVHSSEHRCAGTGTPLVIGAPIVSLEVEDISMVPVIRPSDRQRRRDVTRP
jgi:hypothetical protein